MSIYGELSEGNVLKGTVSGGQSLSGSADKINVIKGESAYEIALLNGFKGTQAEWLESLKGEDGKTPYIQNGYWYIDGVNLGVKAEGKPGSNGTSVTITRIIESTESGGTNIVEFSDGSRLNVRNGKDGEGGGGGVIEETDPTVPVWAKQPNKPSYTASEVGALPATTKIPTKTSDLENDSEYVQLDDLSPYAKKKDIPSVPTKVSELTNDSGYLTSVPDEYVTETELAAKKYLTSYTETDPTVPSWAKQPEKPTYTAAEVGAEGKGAVSSAIVSHNTNPMAHNDIRVLITELANRLNALANSDDTTLDQMAEVVAYIKANRDLIEQITTGKVNTTDIVNNLTTNVATKPLSAAQGVALKALIDAITVPTKVSQLTNDKGYLTSFTESDPTVPDWAKAANKPTYTKSEVGLGSVDNIQQYSAVNQPPYPVTSVNGKKGAVVLTMENLGLQSEEWTFTLEDGSTVTKNIITSTGNSVPT